MTMMIKYVQSNLSLFVLLLMPFCIESDVRWAIYLKKGVH